MSGRELTNREQNQLSGWKRFHEDENGVMPSKIAALYLGVSTSAVYQAGERGWLKFFSVGRDRWYGAKTLSRYRAKRQSGGNWDVFRSNEPRNCSEDGTDKKGDWTPIEK